MSTRIADRDITEENALGQTVVVVPKGQRIPDSMDVPPADSAEQPGSPAGEDQKLDAEEARARLGKTSDEELKDIAAMVAVEVSERGLLEDDEIAVPESVVPGETPGWPVQDDELVALTDDERWAAVTLALEEARGETAEVQKKLEEAQASAAAEKKTAAGKGKKGK